MAPVRGWLARAERLLETEGETPAHAWFAVVRTYERMLTGDVPGARPWARGAIEVGSRSDPAAQGPPDLVITGASLGHLDIAWEEPGLALFLRSLASFPG